MGASPIAPPPGFTLDAPALPEGFTLDTNAVPPPPSGFTVDGAGKPIQDAIRDWLRPADDRRPELKATTSKQKLEQRIQAAMERVPFVKDHAEEYQKLTHELAAASGDDSYLELNPHQLVERHPGLRTQALSAFETTDPLPRWDRPRVAKLLPALSDSTLDRIAGTQRALAGLIDFFRSPGGIATVASGGVLAGAAGTTAEGLAHTAGRGTAAFFTGDMAQSLPAQADQLVQSLQADDRIGTTEGVLNLLGTGLFLKGTTKHAATPGVKSEVRSQKSEVREPAVDATVAIPRDRGGPEMLPQEIRANVFEEPSPRALEYRGGELETASPTPLEGPVVQDSRTSVPAPPPGFTVDAPSTTSRPTGPVEIDIDAGSGVRTVKASATPEGVQVGELTLPWDSPALLQVREVKADPSPAIESNVAAAKRMGEEQRAAMAELRTQREAAAKEAPPEEVAPVQSPKSKVQSPKLLPVEVTEAEIKAHLPIEERAPDLIDAVQDYYPSGVKFPSIADHGEAVKAFQSEARARKLKQLVSHDKGEAADSALDGLHRAGKFLDLTTEGEFAAALAEAARLRGQEKPAARAEALEMAREQKRHELWEQSALRSSRPDSEAVPVQSLYVDDVLKFGGHEMKVTRWLEDAETGLPAGVELEGPFGKKFVGVKETLHKDAPAAKRPAVRTTPSNLRGELSPAQKKQFRAAESVSEIERLRSEAEKELAGAGFQRQKDFGDIQVWTHADGRRIQFLRRTHPDSGGSGPHGESMRQMGAAEIFEVLAKVRQALSKRGTKMVHQQTAGSGSRYIAALIDGRPWMVRIATHSERTGNTAIQLGDSIRRKNLQELAPGEEANHLSIVTNDPKSVTWKEVQQKAREQWEEENGDAAESGSASGAFAHIESPKESNASKDVRDISPDLSPSSSRMVSGAATESQPAASVNTGALGSVGMGGAKPGEFTPRAETATSIKNATVDAERVQRGLPPAMEAARRSFETVWDEAMARIDRAPETTDALIAELKAKPRALTDIEDALLLQRQVDLQNDYAKATRELAQAHDDAKQFPNRLADFEEAKVHVTRLSDQLVELYDVNKAAGTETGRGLNARKMLAYEDFSLAKMETDLRVAQDGAPLTDAQRVELETAHKRITETQSALDEALARLDKEKAARAATDATNDLIERVKLDADVDPQVRSIAERITLRLETAADAARARLRERLGRTSAGVDPTILSDLAIVGASHIARGTLEFSRWSRAMLKEFGDDITPYLTRAWEASTRLVDDAVDAGAPKPKVEKVRRAVKKMDSRQQRTAILNGMKEARLDGRPNARLGRYVQRLAETFVREGIKTRDGLIDAVHQLLVLDFDPKLTRRQAMDAISGYGDFRALNTDAVKVELRDLKGQMQQVAKLEDLLARTAPKKTGLERRTLSDEERRLVQKVEDYKKKFGVATVDPVRQLKTALEAVKTRMRNRIADLKFEISTGKRIVNERGEVKFDAAAEALKLELDALKAEHDKIFTRPELSEEQRLALATRAVEKNIAEYEQRLAARDASPLNKIGPTTKSAALDALRARRDALRAEFRELQNADENIRAAREEAKNRQAMESARASIEELTQKINAGDVATAPANKLSETPELTALRETRAQLWKMYRELQAAAKPKRSAEEIQLTSLKTRLATAEADYLDRVARNDFSPRVRKPIHLDAEALAAKASLAQAKAQWQRGVIQTRLNNRTAPQKIWAGVKEAVNLPRTVLSSWDVSAVLRQGGFITIGHPLRAAKSIGSMFKALASERQAAMIEQEILSRPNAPLYARAKLYLAPRESLRLSAMEEQMMSRFAERVPGIKPSNRAYITFLNKLRADSFDTMLDSVQRRGPSLTTEELQAIGNYINVATGRGNMGNHAAAAETLATVFFSPRLVLSRFQLLAGQPLYRGSARTRTAVATEYGRFLAGLAVVYGLANLAGAKLEDDPRSSDFGKLNFDGTRVDPLAGLSQSSVLLSRLATGETKSLGGNVRAIRGPKLPFGAGTAADVLARFLRSKLSPVVGAALDAASGQDLIGQPVTAGDTAASLLVPLSFRDILDVMKQHGIAEGTALTLLSLFGWGLQSIDDQKPSARP
jgi:hypothetical protein